MSEFNYQPLLQVLTISQIGLSGPNIPRCRLTYHLLKSGLGGLRSLSNVTHFSQNPSAPRPAKAALSSSLSLSLSLSLSFRSSTRNLGVHHYALFVSNCSFPCSHTHFRSITRPHWFQLLSFSCVSHCAPCPVSPPFFKPLHPIPEQLY